MIPELSLAEMVLLINKEWSFASEVRFDPDSIVREGDVVQGLAIWQVRMPDGGWEGMAQTVAFKYQEDPINEWRIA